MWEFCVNAGKQNVHLLEILSERIEKPLKQAHGVKTIISTPKNSCLVLACKKENQIQLQAKLKIALADVICKNMKFDFLKAHMFFDSDLCDVLLKIFTYFDLSLERSITIKAIFLPKNLCLESFLNFRLSFLKQKWKELCQLTNANNNLIQKKENSLEFLRFLFSNLDSKQNCLVLNFKTHTVFAQDEKKSTKISNLSDEKSKVLELVVENFSNHIKIIKSSESHEIQSILISIFEGNIEMF